MSLSSCLTAQSLTERERKIKQIYDTKIEQLITNCTANSIIKDGINTDLRDSINVVKSKLNVVSKSLITETKKANKYQTFFIICLVLTLGLGFIVFKLLTKK